jgi:polyhydroxybutyrate depolymerase
VVFALHGGSASSGLAMHFKVDYTPVADREGFVVLYPSGTEGWNNGVAHKYTGGVNTSDDLGFFRAMFDTLIAEGVADAQRIYITGGSNGGVMTYKLLSEMADRIAGAGVAVTTLPVRVKTWPKPSRPVPILIMLGTADPMMPWNGTRGQQSAQDTIAYWKNVNGCTGEGVKREFPDKDPNDACRVRSERWEGKAPVLFYTLEGHGHGFPMQKGFAVADTGPKTRDISAPEEFWKFFQAVAQSSSSQPTAKP